MIAIVIPNRTKRWFHQWTPEINLNAGSPAPAPAVQLTRKLVRLAVHRKHDAGYYMGPQRELTGLQEQIGVSIPITSGNWFGISRDLHVSDPLNRRRHGIPCFALDDQLPQGRIDLIAPRRENESEAEWGMRCAIITNVGAPDA